MFQILELLLTHVLFNNIHWLSADAYLLGWYHDPACCLVAQGNYMDPMYRNTIEPVGTR